MAIWTENLYEWLRNAELQSGDVMHSLLWEIHPAQMHHTQFGSVGERPGFSLSSRFT